MSEQSKANRSDEVLERLRCLAAASHALRLVRSESKWASLRLLEYVVEERDAGAYARNVASGFWAISRRRATMAERLERGRPPVGSSNSLASQEKSESVALRFHEYLEVARVQGQLVIRCRRCGHAFCSADDNYKRYALEVQQDLEDLAGHRVPSGEPYVGMYLQYVCPACATLLQVDVYCPEVGGETPLWDIQLDADWLQRAV